MAVALKGSHGRSLAACLLALASLIAGAARADEPVRFCIAVEPYPPFTVKDAAGLWQGLEPDLRDAICKQMQMTCEWTEVNFDGLIPALLGKKCDVIWSSLTITAERRKSVIFSDRYYGPPTTIVARADLKATPTPAGLAGKTIGATAYTTAEAYALKYFKGTARDVKTFANQDDLNLELAEGRLDAGIADIITQQAFMDTDAGKFCCRLLGNVAPDGAVLGEGVGAGARKEDTGLRDKINVAINAVRASGEFDAITRRYFAFDIYGD